MKKKEYYKHFLPHFQQPGQAYFVTWNLKDVIPKKALSRYTDDLDILKAQIDLYKSQHSDDSIIKKLTAQYILTRKKYIKAYDDLLALNKNRVVDLSKPENLNIIIEAIRFWEGKKLQNYACCIMPNHVHWIFKIMENDLEGNPIYLQDIMHSVKRQTAIKINKFEGRSGALWQKESFDTTIRNEEHLYYAIEYTLNNPLNAGLATNRNDWPGNFIFDY